MRTPYSEIQPGLIPRGLTDRRDPVACTHPNGKVIFTPHGEINTCYFCDAIGIVEYTPLGGKHISWNTTP